MSTVRERVQGFFARAGDERYFTAEEWAQLSPARQAIELAKLDDRDVFGQAGIIAQAERRPIWGVITDWQKDGLLGDGRAK